MKWPHWLEGCRGQYVAVSYVMVSKYEGTENPAVALGTQSRPIARCDTCGKLFATETIPGKWTLEQLNEMQVKHGQTS